MIHFKQREDNLRLRFSDYFQGQNFQQIEDSPSGASCSFLGVDGPDQRAVVDEQPGGVDGGVAVLDGVREERPAGRVDVVGVGRAGLQEEEGQEVRLVVQPPVEQGAHGRQGGVAGRPGVRPTEVEAEAEQLVNAVQHVGKGLPSAT